MLVVVVVLVAVDRSGKNTSLVLVVVVVVMVLIVERSRVYPCRSSNQRKRSPPLFWIGSCPRHDRWPCLTSLAGIGGGGAMRGAHS